MIPVAGLSHGIREICHPLTGSIYDYEPLLDAIGNARLVLLGDASHGTHEFYRERAQITRRLIREKDIAAVAVEAGWPDAYRVNCYVRGEGDAGDPIAALGEFQHFPAWMWRNQDVVDFIAWLRAYNDGLSAGAPKIGFYGLDFYSLYGSAQKVVEYLDRADPEAARRARYRYGCFDHFGEDTQAYGYAASINMTQSCENEVVGQLLELQRQRGEYARRDGRVAEDELFFAEQNARLVRNAERYYRSMFGGRVSSWNLRDSHMADTLEALSVHLERQSGQAGRIVVWEHNSHLGDARATGPGEEGQCNVGQFMRERHGDQCFLAGMTTYHGTVTAASDWDGPAQQKRVRPALQGSYEAVFHEVGFPQFSLLLRSGHAAISELQEPKLERAIGVIYRPESERPNHYFFARMPRQFDAVLHFDTTRAVEPLERSISWTKGEEWETFPSGV